MKRIIGSHCSYCGHAFAEHFDWPRECSNCKNTSYKNPTPVVVSLIKVFDESKPTPRGPISFKRGILLVKRDIEPKLGEWALPGGYLDMNETWQKGCVRETAEEVGLDLIPDYFQLFDVQTATNGNLLIFGLYLPVFYSSKIKFVPNKEVSQIKVCTEPEELAFPTHTEILKKILLEGEV